MAAITTRDASWNNHTFAEVETHLKGRLGKINNVITTGSSVSNVTCSITGSANDGMMETKIYENNGSSAITISVSTNSGYKTPENKEIAPTCKSGGYVEINFLNIGGTIYARGL